MKCQKPWFELGFSLLLTCKLIVDENMHYVVVYFSKFLVFREPPTFQNVAWPTVNPDEPIPSLLIIDKEPAVVQSPFQDRVNFWKSFGLH